MHGNIRAAAWGLGVWALGVWALALVSVESRAENLLGSPEPLDPRKPGAVVLHGGGTVTDDVFERFIELAGGKEARIVFVPCAGYCPGDYATVAAFRTAVTRRFGAWVGLVPLGKAASLQFLATDNPADADREAFLQPLANATGVWFSGGAQSRLNWRFVGDFPRQTRFQQLLRGVVERGGVVGGTSAGMAILPEVITLREERGYASSPATAVAAHGFGIFSQAIVEQHFDGRGGRLERFTGLLRDNARLDRLAGRAGAGEKMLGIAVEERTALVVQGSRVETLGTGKAHLFIKSVGGRSLAWHEVAAGEKAELRRDMPDLVRLAAPR